MEKSRNIILISVVASVFFVLVGMVFLKPDSEYSKAERRNLKQQPDASLDSVLSGRFMSEFEEYGLDQFPLRDSFRGLKAMTTLKLDNNDLYVETYRILVFSLPYIRSLSSISNLLPRFPDYRKRRQFCWDYILQQIQGKLHHCRHEEDP